MNFCRSTLVCCLLLALSACKPQKTSDDERVQFSDVASRLEPRAAVSITDKDGAFILMDITRLDFPLAADLQPFWEQLEIRGLPYEVVMTWRANGVNVGLLDASRMAQVSQAMPPPINQVNERLRATEQPTSLIHSRHLTRPVKFHLEPEPLATELAEKVVPLTLTLRDGRVQFLVQARRGDEGQVLLEIIPHHFVPQQTLRPRSPLERDLDGQIFYDLALPLTTRESEQFLFIGLNVKRVLERIEPEPATPAEEQPPVPADSADAPADASIAPDEQAATPAPDNPAQPAQPQFRTRLIVDNDQMGTHLFAADRLKKPIQMLLIIRLHLVVTKP